LTATVPDTTTRRCTTSTKMNEKTHEIAAMADARKNDDLEATEILMK
jgi:hypothetical protein